MHGPPCACFSTCSPKTTREFLRSIPATVTTHSSPWYQYLRATYGSDVPLPYHLTNLRYVYHHDAAWHKQHPGVEWPMPPCVRLPSPLGGTPDGQWWAPMNWQVRKRIGPVRGTPKCDPAACARWLSSSGEVNQSTHEAARERELKLHIELFAEARNKTTRGTRWHYTSRRFDGANPDPLLPNGSWVEVMRTRTQNSSVCVHGHAKTRCRLAHRCGWRGCACLGRLVQPRSRFGNLH